MPVSEQKLESTNNTVSNLCLNRPIFRLIKVSTSGDLFMEYFFYYLKVGQLESRMVDQFIGIDW